MSIPLKKFTGKKLLLLGTNSGTCDMVNYARSQGAYVIVTDNLPSKKSPAKLIADEAWPISTADVDTLEQMAIKNKIDGITAAASDFNVERAMTLCERLEFPFYGNRKQWDICSNKERFKQLCQAYNVPVPRQYVINWNSLGSFKNIQYPVVVKPVDGNAGKGVYICRSEEELIKSYSQACSMSASKQVIIEEYFEGDEFTAAYTIKDGEYVLTYGVDIYVYPERSETSPLQQAHILQSKYINKYIAELNAKVIKMFQSIGIANGFIFVQSKRDNQGFHILETNYRLAGFLLYRFTRHINGINYMEMLVNHALTGKMTDYNLNLIKHNSHKLGCCLSLVSKGGILGKIIGLEKLQKKTSLIDVDRIYDEGDYIEKLGTLKQVVLRLYLLEDNVQALINSIKEVQNTVKVLDDKGKNMLIPPFDVNRI